MPLMPSEQPLRIAMWSGPRNISTAMMRSWGNRPDTFVCDEAFRIGPCACEQAMETGLGANGIITEPELMEATGYAARGRLVSHLDRCGIPFFAGNSGQIWTTLDAINGALKPEPESKREVEF